MQPLETFHIETDKNPDYAVIWMHGLGADAHDFEPLVPKLVADHWPAIRFIFPNAPKRPITVNQGLPMRAWYDVAGFDIVSKQDETGMRASMQAIDGLIEEQINQGIPSTHIFVAGFSQGGAMALATGLRFKHELAGIIALSSYLPLAEKTASERHQANNGIDIFQAHGNNDPVIAIQHAQATSTWLKQAGYTLTWHSYAMAHQVCAEEIIDLRTWLEPKLAI